MKPEERANIIEAVIRDRGYIVNHALINSKAGKDLISNMKKGQAPSFEKIILLADYLDVSLDVLVRRKPDSLQQDNERNLEDEIIVGLIADYKTLDYQGKKTIIKTMDSELDRMESEHIEKKKAGIAW